MEMWEAVEGGLVAGAGRVAARWLGDTQHSLTYRDTDRVCNAVQAMLQQHSIKGEVYTS